MNDQFHDSPVIIFDGCCSLCARLIMQIKKQDKLAYFQYIPSQGPRGRELLMKYNLYNLHSDSVVLIDQEGVTIRSMAVFKIAQQIGGWWKIFKVLQILPPKVNDYLYDFVARHRFIFFGRRHDCVLFDD